MRNYKLLNNVLGWVAFAISAIVYTLTLEDTASFWDCGEFISSAFKLEVGHPPGNPIFMLTARFFANFASDPTQVAFCVNLMSGLLSAGTILFLFWTITHLASRLILDNNDQMTTAQGIAILGSGLVGSLLYAFTDTFWFSAVEGEVYAYSSFCTAVVFWLILKWEQVADQPYAERYIILIAYLLGISIGVHLLNLLCIPAIVLVYYYKKNPEADLKGSFKALLFSAVLIVALLYGLIPGFVKVAGWAELFFVNTIGLPFNYGVIIYFFAVLAVISWGIYETYQQKSITRIKISLITGLSLTGVPFIGDSPWIGILIIIALSAFLFIRKQFSVQTANIILLSLMTIIIGYSSYTLILIRSNANPPMDQNAPDDIFTLARYLNREQYGDRPLAYGYTFASDVVRDESGRPVSEKGSAMWAEEIKTDSLQKDKYIVTGYKEDYVFNPELNMLFPRMYSRDPNHVSAYKDWSNFTGTPVKVTINGETKTVMKPTILDNLKFFITYQLNFMYWRYFFWNFVGRQNDIQGHGEVQNGSWITGFNFIDQFFVGDQTTLSPEMAKNHGRNAYYMMPLILGLIGFIYQAFKGKKGIQQFWVVFFLFFMTGLAIVVYLNQTPYQPRERDYAYAGSFYAYSIWIGLGVLAIAKFLSQYISKKGASIIASIVCLAVPAQMLSQNWDDHNRSGRTIARDFGKNYLSCIDENGIIFTNGDNDTFPLWYVQETEGFRTDVRVCNLSYLQTDWYIDQMKRPAYESAALPIAMKQKQYSQGELDFAYLTERINKPYPLNSAMSWLLSDDKRTKTFPGVNEPIAHFPAKEFIIPIDSATIVEAGIVAPEMADSIVPEMFLSYKNKNGLYKNEIAILDMLNTNSQEGWKRPIYFATSVSSDLFMNLNKYFSSVGLAYQVVPIAGENANGSINTEKSYDNIMNKFKWGGIDNPDVYIDETGRRMARAMRGTMTRLAVELAMEGKPEKARDILNLSIEKLPSYNVPLDESAIYMSDLFLTLEDSTKADALLTELGDNAQGFITWTNNLRTYNQFISAASDAAEKLKWLNAISNIYNSHGKKEKAQKYLDLYKQMATAFDARLKSGK